MHDNKSIKKSNINIKSTRRVSSNKILIENYIPYKKSSWADILHLNENCFNYPKIQIDNHIFMTNVQICYIGSLFINLFM